MKLARFAFRSASSNLSHECYGLNASRSLSTNPFSGNLNQSIGNNNEHTDAFERRIFEGGSGNSSDSSSLFRNLDRLDKARNTRGGLIGGSEESYDSVNTTFSGGMQGRLREAARYFEYDSEELDQEGYAFRPDVSFKPGMNYEPKNLDLTKPGVRKTRRNDLEVTTKKVLEDADFRNVKFLAQFITEAGIIIKRSMTGISAKAQRKVAREIKTARAFGLMPFTTMGTKSFVYGKTMENLDEDYEYRSYDRQEPADFDAK